MTIPRVRRATLDECAGIEGAVVVIDVLRSFTTSAVAFARGASRIFAVDSLDAAWRAASRHPGALMLGAFPGGAPIPEFDLPNSPARVDAAAVAGRTIVLLTAGGARGLIAARRASVRRRREPRLRGCDGAPPARARRARGDAGRHGNVRRPRRRRGHRVRGPARGASPRRRSGSRRICCPCPEFRFRPAFRRRAAIRHCLRRTSTCAPSRTVSRSRCRYVGRKTATPSRYCARTWRGHPEWRRSPGDDGARGGSCIVAVEALRIDCPRKGSPPRCISTRSCT